MAIPSRQIGWSTQSNLLWEISKELEQLIKVTAPNKIKNLISLFKLRVGFNDGVFEAETCLNATLTNIDNLGLLDKSSLIITPNAYNPGVLYDVVPNSNLGDMDVVRATTATRVNELGLIEEVGLNIPRLDYSNGSCPSLLVEPQRTNLSLYSEQFDNAYWAKIQAGVALAPVVTQNIEIAPDGTTSADRIVFSLNGGTSSGDISQLESELFTSVSITRTQSFYIKTTDGTTKVFSFVSPTGNLIPITVTSTYQRFTYTETGINAGTIRLRLRGSASGEGTSTTASIAIWGAQYEDGSYPTSYIPTVASTVTRNADVISKTGISSLIGQTEGTLFSSFYYNGNAINGIQIYPLYIGQGNYFDSISIGIYDDSLLCRIFKDGVNQNYFTSSALSIGNHKVAFVYANNNLKLFLDGVLIATDISATIPICDQIYCSSVGTTTNPEKININNNILYKTALTDTECISLTTL
jgi:hypothetical protein